MKRINVARDVTDYADLPKVGQSNSFSGGFTVQGVSVTLRGICGVGCQPAPQPSQTIFGQVVSTKEQACGAGWQPSPRFAHSYFAFN